MVEESGETDSFNAAEWLAQWLEEPLPALADGRPVDLMDTAEGQAIVSNLLARMQARGARSKFVRCLADTTNPKARFRMSFTAFLRWAP